MTNDLCGAISFKTMPDLGDDEVADLAQEEEIVEIVELSEEEDFGLDKQDDEDVPVEEVAATDDDDDEEAAGAINLKASSVSMSAPEQEAEQAEGDETLAFVLGVICTLGIQVVIAGGYYAYTKYNAKKKSFVAESIPDEANGTMSKAMGSSVIDNEKRSLDEMVQSVQA